jgi:protein-L-isoaspartate(D-aspartate) O-methyltransferase
MPDFEKLRRQMVERYKRHGYIKTKEVAKALLNVPREEFMENRYREQAYDDRPYPIPGDGLQTISAPYMYPVTYEPLELKLGHRFLEVGAGSGYGAAIAQELVGEKGFVLAIEINEITYRFAKENLERTGYSDVKLVEGDGTLGYLEEAPYNAISITAASPNIPPPLIQQLKPGGRLIAPIGFSNVYGQDLVLIIKNPDETVTRRNLMKVSYVPLRGEHGLKL